MLLKVDAKALEWRVKAFLSQDQVACDEIRNGIDQHEDAVQSFKLPDRLTGKKFNFRMIFADAFSEMGYRKPAFAYANDPEFVHVSESVKVWADIVGRFFDKYRGMYQHGIRLIDEVQRNQGILVNITGREYSFARRPNGQLPHSQILNYPVQGLAAELMALARTALRQRLIRNYRDYGKTILLMNTVHDDIEVDVVNDPKTCYNICIELEKIFDDLPTLFEKYFGVKFNIPLGGEVSYDKNLFGTLWDEKKQKFEMHPFIKDKGIEQFAN